MDKNASNVHINVNHAMVAKEIVYFAQIVIEFFLKVKFNTLV